MSFPFEEYRKAAENLKHSLEFIDRTVNYARILDAKGLPVIFSLEHFALQVGMPLHIIDEIIFYRFNQYTRYRISKKKKVNEFRYLMRPDSKLLYLQKWINKNILQKIPLSDSCTAYAISKSPYLNAREHSNADQILRVDLLKFFDTITELRVQATFESFGYTKQLSAEFAQLTTAHHNKGFWNNLQIQERQKLAVWCETKAAILPQGAPTSPQLSNIIATGLDVKFEGICKALGCRYSRYADDMIFSTTAGQGILPDMAGIYQTIHAGGFVVNESKTRLFKKGMKQYVTGFTVTHDAHIPKKTRKEIFMHLYFSKKFGPYNHLRMWMAKKGIQKEIIYNFQDWLRGKIAFVFSVDPEIGRKMFEIYNTIDWTIDEAIQSINVEQSGNKG